MHALRVLASALWRPPRYLCGQSILPAHVAWENVHLGTILGDGASRDGNAAFAQDLDDLVIAQRRASAFMFDKVENGLLDADVAERFACGRLVATGEKVSHLENALGCGHVFAGNGAADRGLMHADSISNLCHGHRLQMRRAVVKKIALLGNDLLRDVKNRLLTLMD